MIISRTPFRVSLFGGGTDYPTWFEDNGGAVLGMAINKYCYISVRYLPPFFDHKHRIVYSEVENVKTIDEIKHPAVRAVFQDMDITDGLEIHHDGDLPARSGLGSSSSFVVGLLNALNALNGHTMGMQYLANKAIYIEQQVLNENVGNQDQIWAAHGGFSRIDFCHDGSYRHSPLVISAGRERELLGSMMLFFTGISRYATDIAGKKIANLKSRKGHIVKIAGMVSEAENILGNPDRPLKEIGKMLHESWLLKRDIADGVSNDQVDEIYQAGLDAGAVGGKILGAGGGGFILFYVEPENQHAVRERLARLTEVSFGVDRSGSKIVVYEPDGLESR